jgi:hypothetical protein
MPTGDDYIEPFPYYRGSAAQLPAGTLLPEASTTPTAAAVYPELGMTGGYDPRRYSGALLGDTSINLPGGGSGGGSGGGAANSDLAKALFAAGANASHGSNDFAAPLGYGATGASIGLMAGGPVGAAIGGGIGLGAGILSDIFGGGGSDEQEQVQLEYSKAALQELQRRATLRDAMKRELGQLGGGDRAPIQRLENTGQHPTTEQLYGPHPQGTPPPPALPPSPQQAAPAPAPASPPAQSIPNYQPGPPPQVGPPQPPRQRAPDVDEYLRRLGRQ